MFGGADVEAELSDVDDAREVDEFLRDQVTRMMSEAFAIRLLDAFDIGGPHVRVHDENSCSAELVSF
jgi:hypothetical protein